MADKVARALKRASGATVEAFAHRAVIWWLPLLYCLISSLFYLRTYDSAQVKITIMQMGGLALLTMWVCRLVEMGRGALNKDDLITLSPFLAYLGIGIVSFLHAPYHMASVDFFLRHCFFMIAALIVIYEFEGEAMDRLIRILTFTAWIAVGYGFIQFVDNTWFPKGIGKGIDPFIWRGAFGERVFSTYGNPNFFADFLVIMFPILLMQYLKTRKWSLLPLMALLVIDLYKTGTKGAWLGFAMVAFLFGVIAFTYFKKQVAPYKMKVLSLVVVVVGGFIGVVAKDLTTRMVSVNFRLFTWEATWENIRTQPLLGVGVGGFPPLYPAFRRPPIFHIEGKHNTETDHAENEYLEQFMDNGMLGFGIFIWLILSTLVVGFRSLGHLTTTLVGKDGSPHPRAYDLIGVMVALMGMLGHNFFDVSMRFVSSGVYLGLLSGMVVNLARGKSLYELHLAKADAAPAALPPEKGGLWDQAAQFLIWPARLAAWGGLIYLIFLMDWNKLTRMSPNISVGGIIGEFQLLQGPIGRGYPGEQLQWWLSWTVFVGCIGAVGWIMARLAYLAENPFVPALVLAMLQPMYIFWGYFKADIHHNIAIYFSKERNWDQALANYFRVRELNPNFVMSLYFMGNVYNDRFDMRKVYNPAWGDKDNQPRDDYDRAMDAYDGVRQLAPNYVQMHHQVGSLHVKRAEWAMNQGKRDEAEQFLERAMVRFKMYQAIDPVFAPNYFRMAQVHMVRGQQLRMAGREADAKREFSTAASVYDELVTAPQCAVDPKLLDNDFLRKTILSYQEYIKTPDGWTHRHESLDAYINLGNAHFMADEWEKAESAYLRGLQLDPNSDNAKRNLQALYQKAQQAGRLKPVPAPQPGATLTRPYTGYEIVPARKR